MPRRRPASSGGKLTPGGEERDRLPEVDDGAIWVVVIAGADLARMPPGHDAPSRGGEVESDTVEVMKRGEPHRDEER